MVGLLLAVSVNAHAFNYNNWFFNETNCATYIPNTPAPPTYQAFCLDKTSGAFYTWNGSAFAAPAIIAGTNQALIIKSPVAMCTTSNSVGALCAEPTQTFSPTGFADTSYSVSCTCASIGTNVPIVQGVTKASNTLVVTVAALTAASAQCAEVDCLAIHQ